MAVARPLVILLVLGACGTPDGAFVCAVDEECTLGGTVGTCQDNGYCSFPDPGCISGQRYGEYGPVGVGGRCVPAPGADDGGGLADAAPDSSVPLPPDATPAPDAALPPDAPLPDAGDDDLVAIFSPNLDAWIDSENVTQNHGSDPTLRVDGEPLRHALLRFEVSGLPMSSLVTSAELHIFTTTTGRLPQGSVQVFRLLQGWVEGGGNGTNGTVNWNERSDGAGWSNAGAGTPNSRAGAPSAEFVPSSNDTEYVVPLPASLVQTWRAAAATNSGVILVARNAGSESAVFVSKEGAASRRPTLRVTYRVP